MAVLSDADIIANNSIGVRLDEFRRLLESRCDNLGISRSLESRIAQLVEVPDAKDLALVLVLALQTAPLAMPFPKWLWNHSARSL